MSGVDLAGLIKPGVDILTTTVNRVTGKILAQTGSVTEQTTDSDNVEWWQQVCWASRPSKPSAGSKAAQGVVLACGDHDICISSQDVRCLDQYGNLDFGEFCAYAPGEDGLAQGCVIGKKDGSVTVFTTDTNTKAGKSVYFRVAKGTNDATGLPDGFTWFAPWGTTKFDSTGYHTVHVSGASFHLGGIYGMPAPLDQISSYIKLSAGTIHLECSGLSIGLVGATPVALQIPTAAAIFALQLEIAALQVECAAIAAALVAVTNIAPLVPATHGAAAAAGTAAVGVAAAVLVTGAATLGAQTLLMPATTSST
jgi:hypothetical protein